VDISRPDRRRRLTLVLLVITSLALVSLDERGSGVIDNARTAAQDVISPVQDLADDVINPIADWFDGLGRADELQSQNERLQRQLDAAKSEIAAAKASLARLKTYEEIFDLPDIADSDGVVAEVVGEGAGNFSRTFRISKGSDDGIALDMPVVVNASGRSALVGRVVRVSSSHATVERIDDRTFGVGAQLVQGDGNGPQGIATGQPASSLLKFQVIDNTGAFITMKKGDVAVTIGSERDPRGLVIGTVTRTVSAGGAAEREAQLRPVVPLDALTVVKVLRNTGVPAQ